MRQLGRFYHLFLSAILIVLALGYLLHSYQLRGLRSEMQTVQWRLDVAELIQKWQLEEAIKKKNAAQGGPTL